jgi:hypothetical protein
MTRTIHSIRSSAASPRRVCRGTSTSAVREFAKTDRNTPLESSLGERKWDAVIEQFGNEDISTWPFAQIGAAAFARGQAYYGERVSDKADADLSLTLEFTSDSRVRISIVRTMGHNRETVLENDDLALKAYRTIATSNTNTTSRIVLARWAGRQERAGTSPAATCRKRF